VDKPSEVRTLALKNIYFS